MRVSQRRPQACRECTKSKRKCDKQAPCSRCRRLHLDCFRERVHLRRDTVRHASEIQFLNSLVGDLETSSEDQILSIVQKVRSRVDQLQSGDNDAAQQERDDDMSVGDRSSSLRNQQERLLQHETTEISSQAPNMPLITAIEHIAWDRNSAGCFPHRHCACQYRRDDLNRGSFQIYGSAFEPMISLLNTVGTEKLIRAHDSHLAWHHNCLHGPTFLEQCEFFWKTGRCDHPLWLAVYCSVLSYTVSSYKNSEKPPSLTDVELENMEPQEFFSAMVQILYGSHFLSSLSVYSVQAIVISTEVAHNLGLSQLNATLFNAAVRIAECLGLHKITDHTVSVAQTLDAWEERVEREVGRRIWCQMVIQDHFAIPFTDTYSISPMQYSTGLPLNADDYDLKDMPVTAPTVSTYVRVLMGLAAVMPDLVDGLGPMKKRKSSREQYEHIIRIDQRLRAIVRDIPSFLLRQDHEKEARIPWLGIARRSLAITSAEKIIMVHRPFLFQSFQNPRYNHSRRTCVAAAMTILREHETIVNESNLSIWTHTAFCITASVILCFEIKAMANNPEATLMESYKAAVIAARSRLASRKCDVLAQRGVAVIDAIFIEGPGIGTSEQDPHDAIDFTRILTSFSLLNQQNAMPHMGDAIIGQPQGYSPTNDLVGVDLNETPPSWDIGNEVEFETWFKEIFNDIQDYEV